MTPEQLEALKRLPSSAIPRGMSTVDPITGRIVQTRGGVTSEYYPTATAGQLDLFGKTIAAGPGEIGGAGGPYDIIEQQFNSLRNFYQDQLYKLDDQNLSDEQYNKALAGMQTDYDTQKARLTDVRNQLDAIRQDRSIAPELKNEAMWRMVVPPERAAAMFPRQAIPPRARITPAEAAKYQGEFTKELETVKKFATPWGRNPPDEQVIERAKEVYGNQKELWGYDTMTPAEQQSFDRLFDLSLRTNKFTKKLLNRILEDPEILAGRTYGSQLLELAGQKITGKRVSPFAKGISKIPSGPIIYARNKRTGQRIQSTDNGKTWQPVQ